MPRCPYCDEPVTLEKSISGQVGAMPLNREVVGKLKKEIMYSCPKCDKVLGFGYYMGGLLTGRP